MSECQEIASQEIVRGVGWELGIPTILESASVREVRDALEAIGAKVEDDTKVPFVTGALREHYLRTIAETIEALDFLEKFAREREGFEEPTNEPLEEALEALHAHERQVARDFVQGYCPRCNTEFVISRRTFEDRTVEEFLRCPWCGLETRHRPVDP